MQKLEHLKAVGFPRSLTDEVYNATYPPHVPPEDLDASMEKALHTLPMLERGVILMRCREHWSFKEMGKRMHVRPSTALYMYCKALSLFWIGPQAFFTKYGAIKGTELYHEHRRQ